MSKNELLRVCPYSGEEFYAKRSNQKFENAECRIAYHNHRNNLLRLMRAREDRRLHKNHKILVELMGDEKRKQFKRDFLHGKGFSTKVLTGLTKYRNVWVHALYNYLMYEGQDNTITFIQIDDE